MNRKQSRFCHPRSLDGLWKGANSVGEVKESHPSTPWRKDLPASTSMPRSKAAKNFSPSNISTVSEGSGPRYRSISRHRVASTCGAPTGIRGQNSVATLAFRSLPPPPPSRCPTLLRGRHCSRTCSGSRRLCSAMRFTRCSRSRSQAFRARPPTQVLVVYQSQYLEVPELRYSHTHEGQKGC